MPSYGLDSGLDPLNKVPHTDTEGAVPAPKRCQSKYMRWNSRRMQTEEATQGNNDLILISKIVLISVRLCNSILAAQLLLGIFAIFSFFLKVSQHI